MDFNDIIKGQRPLLPASASAIAERIAKDKQFFVVLDDDPTGTQSISDLPVLGRWRVEDLQWAIDSGASAAYVLTNSRSLAPESARQINMDVVEASLEAGRTRDVRVLFMSRSDSTLRGHFPLEPQTIADALVAAGEARPDGIIVVPAFPEAGRITVDGVHYARAGGSFEPVGLSEFAKDSTFGYEASDLRDWVEEKSGGLIPASEVVHLPLGVLRRGEEAISEVLRSCCSGSVIVADAVEEHDLRQLALGVSAVEAEGRTFVYRVGPSFPRARLGQVQRAPLTTEEISSGARGPGGLVVVGSHVGLTSSQLEHLLAHRPSMKIVEIDVPSILDPGSARSTLDSAFEAIVSGLLEGDVLIYSSRDLVRTDDPEESLAISRTVSSALVEVVQRAVAESSPRFVIAKGGITSSDIATRGLSITRAWARGSVFSGIVSLWEPVEGAAVGIPFVVFAGNVGSKSSLTEAVNKLSSVRDEGGV